MAQWRGRGVDRSIALAAHIPDLSSDQQRARRASSWSPVACGEHLTVTLNGVDVYDPTTGQVRSDTADQVALWMIDTECDGDSFFVRHCYFTGGQDPYKRLKPSLKADIDAGAWATLYRTESRPFPVPSTGKIAVKVINDYGDEVLKVFNVGGDTAASNA